jgi:hypothetical protein
MTKLLLKKMRWLSIAMLVITSLPYILSAQQVTLKSEAPSQSLQPITGHNNLRKLARTYDKQAGSESSVSSVGDNALLRRLYELELLRDPATGLIPEDIRAKELAFAQQMNERSGNKAGRRNARIIENWKARGPYNVGGRTRALAIDLENENILLAGGVSGGMWRSEDNGATWFKTTGSNEMQSVTSVAQDPRPGFTNVWYYATGERIGNSAGAGGGAFFGGNGIYKSTDGGRSWSILPFTADNHPQFNTAYDITFNLAIHPATGDLYAATWMGIRRSTDGGATFINALPAATDTYTDVMVTPGGVLYATFDSDGTANPKGIFRSTDGITWTNITPVGYPAPTGQNAVTWGRAVLGYTPTDENIIYVFTDSNLASGAGFLWRYTHGAATPWTNLSGNLPAFGGTVGNLNTQTGYNMIVKVHPTNPNIVFLAGTNLYRSPNGFTSRVGMSWIGGYSPANNVSMYPNQHPDHHVLLFYPSNPSKALSATDGGIHYTDNILSSNAGILPVSWTSKNNGYLTTQPYTVSVNPQGTGDHLMAGFQDNGSWFTSTSTLTTPWSEALTGDGSYNAFADNGVTRYASSQNGNIYRLNYSSADAAGGTYSSFTRVTPAGAAGFSFVNPFVLDPTNDNMMYLPVGTRIWRNDNLDEVPIFSNATTGVNWTSLANSQVPAGNTITAIAVTTIPANRIYYGTNAGLIFRIDNANVADQPKTDIATGKGLTANGFVVSITVDPANGDRVFAVFSNYGVRSIFYSADAGNSWTDISGNLEENPSGTGTGPSVRWLAIEGNSDRYYVGTSTGLYSTTEINGAATVWTQEDVDGIGNVVVPMVKTRPDGFVAIASHGNGLYTGRFEVSALPSPTLTLTNPVADFEVFKNSPNTIIDITNVFTDSDGDPVTYSVVNNNPALVTATVEGNLLTLAYAPNARGSAIIGILAKSGNEANAQPFTVTVRDIDFALYSKNTAVFNTRPSQLFTDLGNSLAQSADDITVPEGQTWTIDKVLAGGSSTGAIVLNAMHVVIYNDNSGVPGTAVYQSGAIVPASGTVLGDVELVLPAPANLGPGKYWVSVYAQSPLNGGGQWFWKTSSTVTGTQAHFKDPGNLFGRGLLNWTPQSTAFAPPVTPPLDMLFILLGKGTGFNAPTPAAPSDLHALYSTDTRFDLTWVDNATDETGYLIERSIDSAGFMPYATVAPNDTTFSDTEHFDRTITYYYRVAAIGLSDTSAYSNIDSVAVLPDAPVAKLATFVLPGFFVANWNSSIGASTYELDVSSDGFATFLPGFQARPVSATYQLVWGTQWGKQYSYRVRAVNAGGESENSNTIIAASIRDLKLDAVCSDNPDAQRRWRINNPNPFAVDVQWGVHKTAQQGILSAAPGYTYFETNTVKGSNTTIISWTNDFFIPRIDVKGSSKKECRGIESDNSTARYGNEDDGLSTESPFIIDAWPNPTKEKFSIMIASPYEDEVEIEILGLQGERLFNSKTASNVILEVDASRYPAGMYLIKAKQLMFNQTLKLIKQ